MAVSFSSSPLDVWCEYVVDAVGRVGPGYAWGQEPLTVATDCSSSGSAVAGLQALEANLGIRKCKFLFASNTNPAAQRWLQNVFAPEHMFSNMCYRDFTVEGILSADLDGKPVLVPRGHVDIYVCSLPSATSKDQRYPCKDSSVEPLAAMARTVDCLKPRIAVAGSRNPVALQKAKRLLSQLQDEYHIVELHSLSTHHFGIPQFRMEHYMVLLRKGFFLHRAPTYVRDIVLRCQHIGTPSTPSWPVWLRSIGLPVVSRVAPVAPVSPKAYVKPKEPEPKSNSEAETGITMEEALRLEPKHELLEQPHPCSCAHNSMCHLHRCGCLECMQHGPRRLACKWRKSIKAVVGKKPYQAAAANMVKRWRVVRKDSKLKKSPGYFELARARGLPFQPTCLF